jgi:hypothetical protein
MRHVIGASEVHERVGVFYARRASEGTQILQIQRFKSV